MVANYIKRTPAASKPPFNPDTTVTHDLENLLLASDVKCDLMQRGRLPHREVNGVLYTPLEFGIEYKHDEDMANCTIAAELAKIILTHVSKCQNMIGGRGTAYVTLRDTWRFPIQTVSTISVLVV